MRYFDHSLALDCSWELVQRSTFLEHHGQNLRLELPFRLPRALRRSGHHVVVVLNNTFFNELLGTMFRDLGPPLFQLAELGRQPRFATVQQVALQQGCTNTITLAQEGSNTRTQVQFAGGKISAPLAFSGSYNLLETACSQRLGAKQHSAPFDQGSQTVFGQTF